jgi:HEAT repeat protein
MRCPGDLHMSNDRLSIDSEIERAKHTFLDLHLAEGQRIAAIDTLVRHSKDVIPLIEVLMNHFEDDPFSVQQAVIRTLASLQCPDALCKLRELGFHESWDVQREAILALARLNDASGYDRCMYFFCHGTAAQRLSALVYLGKYRTEQALRFFEYLWASAELSLEERRFVALSLLRRGRLIGLSFLEYQLGCCDEEDEILIVSALASVGHRQALLQLQTLLEERGSLVKAGFLRICLNEFISLPLNGGDWCDRCLAWINEQLRKT